MSIKTELIGVDHKGILRRPHVHQRLGHNFLLVQAEEFREFNPTLRFFTNENFGAQMNQDVSFGSIKTIIHDGGTTSNVGIGNADTNTVDSLENVGEDFDTTVVAGMTVEETGSSNYARVASVTNAQLIVLSDIGDTADIFPAGTEAYILNAVWTGTATVGSWDFSTGGVITQSGANNFDEMNIEADVKDEKTLSDFVAITMSINLNTYSDTNNDILVQLMQDSVLIGNAVSMNSVINTGDFAAQQAVFTITSFGLTNERCNGIKFIVTRSGGPQPAFTLDNIQFETGTAPIAFRATTTLGTRFHIDRIRYTFVDVFAGTLTNGAGAFGLAFDAILGSAALTNGIVLNRVQNGELLFSNTFKQLSDFLGSGGEIVNFISDGTDTLLSIETRFERPIILEGDPETNYLELTVQDNLSVFTQIRCNIAGALEVNVV